MPKLTVSELLRYLAAVADKTEGAEVWRALFAEILGRHLHFEMNEPVSDPAYLATARTASNLGQ